MTGLPSCLARGTLPGTAARTFALLSLLCAFAPPASAEDARRKQQIIFAELPRHAVGDAPFELAARASSGLPVAFEVVSGPAVVEKKQLRLTGASGLVIVKATQGGNEVFLPALPAERAFTVERTASPPALLSQPMSARAGMGETIMLSAAASGEPAPLFQWRKDGIQISGATDRTLMIASASPGDGGDYDVVVTNTSGSTTSRRARVTVGRRPQTISFQGPQSAVAGQPVTLSASASSGLPVRLEVVSGAAVLSGFTLTAQYGPVVVQASQSGDGSFDAALPVTETVFVSPAPGSQRIP